MLISVFPNQHTIFVMNAYFEKIIILKNIDFFNGFETLIIFTMPFFLLFFSFVEDIILLLQIEYHVKEQK